MPAARAGLWPLAAAALCLLPASWRAAASVHPPCRKSPELHTLSWRHGHHELVAFGGKGFDWVRKKRRRKRRRSEDLEAWSLPALGRGVATNASAPETAAAVGGAPLAGPVSAVRRLARRLRKKVNMFGDTWAFDFHYSQWVRVVPDAHAAHPTPRWKPSSTTFDDNRGMILFGGCRTTSAKGVMNDLWVLMPKTCCAQHATWTQVFTTNPPEPRRGHITVANSTHLVVLGGKGWDPSVGSKVLTDLWSLPLDIVRGGHVAPLKLKALDGSLSAKKTRPGQWVRGADFPGAPRWGATGTLLTTNGREVLAFFGGRCINTAAAFHSVAVGAYTYYNELWLYDFKADSWTLTQPRGGVAPEPRDHHGATHFDGDLYVFGGRLREQADSHSVLNDLWSYSLHTGSWTKLGAEGVPPIPRFMPGVSNARYHNLDVVAVFGGETLPGTTKRTSLNDVWIYVPNATGNATWIEVFKTDCGPSTTPERPPPQPPVLRAGAEALSQQAGGQLVARAGCAAGLLSFGIAAVAVIGITRHRPQRHACAGALGGIPAAGEVRETSYRVLN